MNFDVTLVILENRYTQLSRWWPSGKSLGPRCLLPL